MTASELTTDIRVCNRIRACNRFRACDRIQSLRPPSGLVIVLTAFHRSPPELPAASEIPTAFRASRCLRNLSLPPELAANDTPLAVSPTPRLNHHQIIITESLRPNSKLAVTYRAFCRLQSFSFTFRASRLHSELLSCIQSFSATFRTSRLHSELLDHIQSFSLPPELAYQHAQSLRLSPELTRFLRLQSLLPPLPHL